MTCGQRPHMCFFQGGGGERGKEGGYKGGVERGRGGGGGGVLSRAGIASRMCGNRRR